MGAMARKAKLYPDDAEVFALDEATGHVLAVWPQGAHRTVSVSKATLAGVSGNASLRADLFDAQFYALDRWAFEALASRESSSHFVQFLVRSQQQKRTEAMPEPVSDAAAIEKSL